jgi:hypothetical protein
VRQRCAEAIRRCMYRRWPRRCGRQLWSVGHCNGGELEKRRLPRTRGRVMRWPSIAILGSKLQAPNFYRWSLASLHGRSPGGASGNQPQHRRLPHPRHLLGIRFTAPTLPAVITSQPQPAYNMGQCTFEGVGIGTTNCSVHTGRSGPRCPCIGPGVNVFLVCVGPNLDVPALRTAMYDKPLVKHGRYHKLTHGVVFRAGLETFLLTTTVMLWM